MKIFWLSFLLAFSAVAKDESKCVLQLQTLTPELAIEPVNEHPGLMKLLRDKGYIVRITKDEDWYKLISRANEELLEKFDNKIYLNFQFFDCSNQRSGLSGRILSAQWKCPVGVNTFIFKVVSHGEVYSPISSEEDFVQGDISKTFKTKGEAESYLLKGFSNIIPSCEEVRERMPEAGRE